MSKYHQRKSREFHEKKGKEDGVTSLPSGVQYKVLNKGTGKTKPKPTDNVKVHYAGTLIDGTEFDSSIGRGEPSSFGVNQVIAGWTEILQLMVIGDKFEVYIPWDKAYGAGGSPPRIPAYSSLIFSVELLGINDKSDL
jgi:FKBP-type peptidyl-prolyl cis-trans isomerase